jgi:2Fe-2S ferredoxin
MITLTIEDRNGEKNEVEIPEGINLSLMEVLKASDYNILATCGGMALCATCHVQVLKGEDNLSQASDMELDMLDTLPNATPESRLACQLRITEEMQGCAFKILGEEQ